MKTEKNGRGNLNYKQGRICVDGDFVRECDLAFDMELERAARLICYEKKAKTIGLTGPTCSGKTTAAKKIISIVNEEGIDEHVISLDDFYKENFSRSLIKGMNVKDIDFDSPDTIDIELLGSFLTDILETGKAKMPRFDFSSGERVGYENISAGKDDIFIFEGIQVLYPEVASLIGRLGGVSMYICAESGLNVDGSSFDPNEIRLMRRLVRDNNFRASSPEFTMGLWDGVRKNEDENIFPHTHLCEVRVDSTLEYELNVLAPYLRSILPNVPKENEYFRDCEKILEKIEKIKGIGKEALSENSLYHEFV